MNLFLSSLSVLINIFYVGLNNATLIVKFGRNAHIEKKFDGVHHERDPLQTFSLRSRQILCDVVILAKHYVGIHRFLTGPIMGFPEWDRTYSDLNNINHQRQCRNPDFLTYIKTLQCINVVIQWFISFNLEDKYMYLLEPIANKSISALQVVAIIERNALLEDINSKMMLDFVSDLELRKDVMEQTCKFLGDKRLRVCSSVYHALVAKGYFANSNSRINYVRMYRRECRKGKVSIDTTETIFHSVMILPCSVNEEKLSPQFYLLSDPRNRASMFILFITKFGVQSIPILKLKGRARKVGGLLESTQESTKK